ncbi:hypothetical protein B0H66DRAFT_644225 [Apodospora peruviana]|uniref:Uncharacterized protein n=1 Tax=Apodospora peruviana TaxID=516989 RepID=A0AAE0LZ83_9PEZI|nr:hypothetical protein B0H66DRAFT_644225 [Apodospora peruviana]
MGSHLTGTNSSHIRRRRSWHHLADMFIEMERHPFNMIGSLMPSHGQLQGVDVRGIANHATFNTEVSPAVPLGPFKSSDAAAHAEVQFYLGVIASGEIGGAVDNSSFPIDAFLAHKFRLVFILNKPETWKRSPKEEEMDRHGLQELVFSSPYMMWPVGPFYEGSNELSDDETRFAAMFRERKRDDLADCVLHGRKAQRFHFAIGPAIGAGVNRADFESLFAGLASEFGLADYKGWEDWKAKALVEYKGNPVLERLLENDGN